MAYVDRHTVLVDATPDEVWAGVVLAVLLSFLLNPLVRAMFAPRDVPARFIATLSREMMVRPIQLRANAEDAAFMIPQAKASAARHQELRMPVAILAGAKDKVIDVEANAERLHLVLPKSNLIVLPKTGHEIPFTRSQAVVDEIMARLDESERNHLGQAFFSPESTGAISGRDVTEITSSTPPTFMRRSTNRCSSGFSPMRDQR